MLASVLASLPADSVDCIITSPPYFRLRNYQDGRQIGLEAHVDDYVHELRLVARKLARVLKPGGSFWLNLGDTFSRAHAQGASEKSLVLAPERLALALIEDGWVLRNKVVWAKTNPMPTSVRDRLSCTHEVVYFFVREPHYFFDLDAIRVPHVSKPSRPTKGPVSWSVPDSWRGPSTGSNTGLDRLKSKGLVGHPLGQESRRRLATGDRRLSRGAPRGLSREARRASARWPRARRRSAAGAAGLGRENQSGRLGTSPSPASCSRFANVTPVPRPGIVLDPFMGSGHGGFNGDAARSPLARHRTQPGLC